MLGSVEGGLERGNEEHRGVKSGAREREAEDNKTES